MNRYALRTCGNILAAVAICYFSIDYAHAADAKSATPTLLRITPSGVDSQEKRQLVLQFKNPLVPVGRMERTSAEVPIEITPPIECQWRWLNSTSLACQLGEKTSLLPATRYELSAKEAAASPEAIQIRDALKAFLTKENGGGLETPKPHVFITQRAKVTSYFLWGWHAPGRPEIRIALNNAVSADSIGKHLSFHLGPTRNVPATLLSVRLDEQGNRAPTPEHDNEWAIIPATDLPLDSSVELQVEPGIISDAGPEASVQDETLVKFDTHTDFRFTGVRCFPLGSSEAITIHVGDVIGENNQCNPQAAISLLFSSPVTAASVKDDLQLTPSLNEGKSDYDPWADVYPEGYWIETLGENQFSIVRSPHERGKDYALPLPVGLKADQLYQLTATGEKLHDAFDRPLTAPIGFSFHTSHRGPRMAVDSGYFSLEAKEDTHLPVAVQNLDELHFHYDLLTANGVQHDLDAAIPVDNATDISYYFPLKIRSLLGATTGAVQGTLSSTPSDEHSAACDSSSDSTCFVAGQVTPFQVHVKLGHFGTMVWVTRLADGSPVAAANVELYREASREFSDNPQLLARGKTDKDGISFLAGSAKLDPKLQYVGWENYRYTNEKSDREILKLRIIADGELAYVPLVQDLLVEPRGPDGSWVSDWAKPAFGHLRFWGTTPQGVYKLGQTIQFKLYARHQDVHGLIPAPRDGYSLEVKDPTGKSVFAVEKLSLNEFGSYSGEFPVAANAAVGWYRFVIRAKFAPKANSYGYEGEDDSEDDNTSDTKDGSTWDALQVLVSDFTPASFHVSSEVNGKNFGFGDDVTVTTLGKLHSGGAYTNAGTRVTASIRPHTLENIDPQFAGYTFGTGAETEQTVFQDESALDGNGSLVRTFKLNEKGITSGDLVVESAVRDDRGKYIANTTTAHYHGRTRYVGLKFAQWAYPTNAPVDVKAVVIDESGKAVSDTPIKVVIQREETKAARVKGPGNAYLTHYEREDVDVHSCELAAGQQPETCTFTPDKPGSYHAVATITDTNGFEDTAKRYTWVHGQGDVMWETEDSNRLDIVPEKTSLKVGERARFLLKNPFPGARALATIERYGVIKRWFQKLESSTPIVEFPVTADLIPGFYFSVVVTSPRVDKPLGENQVDLGKPTMRMGYVKLDVIDPAKELQITVKPAKQEYRPGDEVSVDLTVQSKTKQQPTEVAVAVLDEAVFDLIRSGVDYFDPYKGLYQLEPLDVRNFNLLVQLVGRRSFHKKGANSGGDGGGDLSARSLFKFVSYWNPSLVPDNTGHAHFTFKAPDNLTGWRVLAMAVTKNDEMGLGSGNVKVNRPTEIQSALPNQVTVGDHFEAAFTVMNRTDKERTLEVTIHPQGAVSDTTPTSARIIAKPFDRQIVRVPVETKGTGDITFVAEAGDATDKDAVKQTVPVHALLSKVTSATYGSTVEASAAERFAIPADIDPTAATVSAVLSPSVITSVEGAFRYLRDYPYLCWEQQLTKGVMAAHFAKLKPYLPDNFAWPESSDLPKRTLANAATFQAPNGGMTYFGGGDAYVDPYLSAYTALAFNWLRGDGHEIPAEVETRLHGYLKEMLRKDVMPDFYSRGMAATVRAVALSALGSHENLSTSDFNRYYPYVDDMSLFGKAQFLSGAAQVKDQTDALKQMQSSVLEKLYNQANETGGKFMFNETIDTTTYERILTTPLRDNCAVLSAILDFNKNQKKDGSAVTSSDDIPFKLVRSISQTRKNRDHWENTQENVFCMQSLVDFSREYEKTAPVGTWAVQFDGKAVGEATFKDFRDAPIELSKALLPEDLGKETSLEINRTGQGRMYYSARLSYSPKQMPTEGINSGIEIRREYSVERNGKWELLKEPLAIKQGELVRVDLFLSLPAARNFVVVDDAVPGGLEPVNRDLGTASTVDAVKGELPMDGGSYWFRLNDWIDFATTRWAFYHKELRHDSARFYSDYLPPGNYHLAYTAQAVAAGHFAVMPVHAEEMYDPDVFGNGAPNSLAVQ